MSAPPPQAVPPARENPVDLTDDKARSGAILVYGFLALALWAAVVVVGVTAFG